MEPTISASAVGRTRTVAEPRWSPGGSRLGWVESFAGRTDLVVVPADGSAPATSVTPDVPVTGVGSYGGGAWCWSSDTEVVYAAADGRLAAVPVDGGPARILTRAGRAFAPPPNARGVTRTASRSWAGAPVDSRPCWCARCTARWCERV